MKRVIPILLPLLFILVGCSSSDSPVGVTEAFFRAMEDQDLETIRALGCDRNMERYEAFVKQIVDHKYRVEYDVDVSLASENGDEATVSIVGVIRFYGLHKNDEPEVREIDNIASLVREDGQWKYCLK